MEEKSVIVRSMEGIEDMTDLEEAFKRIRAFFEFCQKSILIEVREE